MAENINPQIEKEPATVENIPDQHNKTFVWLAIGSMVLTVVAWIAGSFSGIGAAIASVAAIVTGAFALRSHKRGVRNTAITSIIAAGVLLVVIVAFIIVFQIALKAV